MSRQIERIARELFEDSAAQQRFIASLNQGDGRAPAIIWTKPRPSLLPFTPLEPFPWQPAFVDRLESSVRPGAEELHQRGAYYCLDLSSVFFANLIASLNLTNPKVIDVCAAPGGKSIFASCALAPSELFCNEVIAKRRRILASNIARCEISNAQVTGVDSGKLSEQHAERFDIVLVDAPCSGQSLELKGIEAAGAFHPATINMNSNRQKRILANSAKLVRPGGYLAYFTCTFSTRENERVVEWLVRKFPEFSPIEVPGYAEFRSHLSELVCYRLFPGTSYGAGGFGALLRKGE